MTEHPDEHGGEVPDLHDDSSAFETPGHGEESFGPAHELDPFAHGHDDPGAHGPVLDDSAAVAHEHLADDAEEADRVASERTPAAIALAAPGGTVFDLIPPEDDAWGGAHDDHDTFLAALHGDHYAAAWAADDGTGATAAALTHASVDYGSSAMSSTATIPGPVSALVYGGADGMHDTATRLWQEFAPETPMPTGPGGEALPTRELLTALAGHVEDPISRSVVDAALAEVAGRTSGS